MVSLSSCFGSGLNLLRTLFYSRGEYKNIAKLGIIIPIVFFILAGFLKEKFSFVGIGIANTLTFAILFFVTIYLARNKDLKFLTSSFLFFLVKNVIAVILAGLFSNINLAIHFKYYPSANFKWNLSKCFHNCFIYIYFSLSYIFCLLNLH